MTVQIGPNITFNLRTIMMTRRQAIRSAALLAASASALRPLTTTAADAATGPFKLPPLPYAFDALEPHIDARTMEIHHDRHHATYVSNLNKAVAGNEQLARKPIDQIIRNLDEVPEAVRTAVRNNGGGHYNHLLFWQMLKKGGGGEPKGALAAAITKRFGGFEQFKQGFSDAAMKVFGSGWAWLVLADGRLEIASRPNQDNPWTQGHPAVLGLDVWEHAYYLKYQNKRADYVAAFFNVINWDFVAERYEAKLKG